MAPIILIVCAPIATNFFLQGLTIKALAQKWEKLHQINDVIDTNIIIVRKLDEKTVKRV